MGASSSRIRTSSSKAVSYKRIERTDIRNGIPPIKLGKGIDADGRSVYSDKPSSKNIQYSK
jgi:hypothetical protein